MESRKVQKRPIKAHGFQCPLHILQCMSWLVISYTIGVSYTIVLPLLQRVPSIAFAVCLSLSELILIVLWFSATFIDPTDLMVYGRKAEDENSEYRAFCSMCNCTVSLSSKHCGQCNRCVDNFDHHCKWLNNCIGGRNYHLFICLIVTLEVATGVVASFTSLLLSNIALDSEFDTRLSHVYSYVNLSVIVVLLSVMLVANACILVANGQLICLHIWLKAKGITTYQYLMMKKARRKTDAVQPVGSDGDVEGAESERQGLESPGEDVGSDKGELRDEETEGKRKVEVSRSVTNVPTGRQTEGTVVNTIESAYD